MDDINSLNKIADEQLKQNVQKLLDKDIFDQATLAMEERYGSGCEEEIDAYFRGAKWMQENLKDNLIDNLKNDPYESNRMVNKPNL